MAESAPALPAASASRKSKPTSLWHAPRFAPGEVDRIQEIQVHRTEGATWRGWLLGSLFVALIAALTPYLDYIVASTRLSFTAFPMAPITILLVLAVAGAGCARLLGNTLGLTRQDLTLVFCMTMVTYALAGFGFFMTWSASAAVPWYGATPENKWEKNILPLLAEDWTPSFFLPQDPGQEAVGQPRPVEWFFQGLPKGASIPWWVWVQPYALWCLAMLFLYGIWFSVAGLLSRRWSEHERLPFPVAQVPEEMITGFEGHGGRKWLFADRLALLGFGLVFALHLWNMGGSSFEFIQSIHLQYFLSDKFTEPPWNAMGQIRIMLTFTVVGMSFLLSRDVAFSLWFFFVVKKALYLVFGQVHGTTLMEGATKSIGTGALLMMALVSLWAARTELGRSFRQALTQKERQDEGGEVAPLWLWGVLFASFIGVVEWLYCWGISPVWAALGTLVLILMMIGLTRLVAEAGAYAALMSSFPTHILTWAATPALLGGKNLLLLTIWDRVQGADFFRIVPLPLVMNALQTSRLMGLRMRTVFAGMALAVVLTLGVSFFSYLGTIYPQGQNQIGEWYGRNIVANDIDNRVAKHIPKIKDWHRDAAKAEQEGRAMPQAEVARVNWRDLSWAGIGGALLAIFAFARTFLFWFPHPAGMVMFMCPAPHDKLWFCFFLGWAFKWGITSFGGMRAYLAWRRFFIGMVVGESAAVILAIIFKILGVCRYEIWMS
jgi:hypothetical protein